MSPLSMTDAPFGWTLPAKNSTSAVMNDSSMTPRSKKPLPLQCSSKQLTVPPLLLFVYWTSWPAAAPSASKPPTLQTNSFLEFAETFPLNTSPPLKKLPGTSSQKMSLRAPMGQSNPPPESSQVTFRPRLSKSSSTTSNAVPSQASPRHLSRPSSRISSATAPKKF